MVPPEFFLEFALTFGTKNSLKKMMTRKVPLVKQIMEGFLAELRARFRSQAFELLVMSLKAAGEGYMVEKNILKDGSEHLFLLLRAAKCHLAFRSVEDVEQLFKDLGLEDLSKEQPTLQEILEEVFAASESSGPQDDLMKDEDFRKVRECLRALVGGVLPAEHRGARVCGAEAARGSGEVGVQPGRATRNLHAGHAERPECAEQEGYD